MSDMTIRPKIQTLRAGETYAQVFISFDKLKFSCYADKKTGFKSGISRYFILYGTFPVSLSRGL